MIFVCWSNQGTTWDYTASVVWSDYLTQSGDQSLPVALSKPNAQTSYIFEKAQIALPTIQDELDPDSSLVIVNHTAAQDSIADRSKYVLDTVIDCHPVSLDTSYNVSIRTEPVGSTCTVIAEIFLDKIFVPDIQYIILLMAWIIADTKNFTSDISTERDEDAFAWLKEMANIQDLEDFVTELLEKSS